MFSFSIPTNSYPFQWPLFPPIDLAVFQQESWFQKVPLISWKYTSLWHDSFWHIPVFLHLRLLLLWKMDPKSSLKTRKHGKSLLYPTGRLESPRDWGGGAFHLWNSNGLFSRLKWDWLTLRAWCKGSVCSGFPLKGKMLVFVLGQFIYLSDSLCLWHCFSTMELHPKVSPSGSGFSKLEYN